MALTYDESPPPATGSDGPRQVHTRARERLLCGGWERDAQARIEARLGSLRARALGYPDLSANPDRAVCQQAATLYDRAPLISHPDDPTGAAAEVLSAELAAAGVWQLQQRVQRQVIGLREMLLRVDVSDLGRLVVRPVVPSVVVADAGVDDPSVPSRLAEWRRRRYNGEWTWTRDVVDPSALEYRVELADGTDVSKEVLGAPSSGDEYEYRLADGTAVLPYATYHAAATGQLWDPYEALELVEGTYEISVLWSFWGHCVRDASWPQRWGIGVTVAGASTSGAPGVSASTVEVDPAVVVMLTPTAEGQAALVGQWAAGADPAKLAEAILTYEARLPQYAGLNPADFARVSGDPRSAYALSLSREGQREAARRNEPTMRAGDEQLLTLCAAGLNRVRDLGLPEVGWQIRYPGIPESREEREARRRDVFERLDRSLISRPGAYAELYGVSLEQAEQAVGLLDAARLADSGGAQYAQVGLPALVQAGIVSGAAARRLLGVGEDAAPTPEELEALQGGANTGGSGV